MKSFLETWKDIAGYEGLYQVSDFGEVRSLKYGKTRVLKTGKHRNGYLLVNLWKEGKRKHHYIHRLVAQAFIQNPNNLPCINHKDEDKTSNVVTNLEWCSYSYNNCYGTRKERVAEANINNPKQSDIVLQMTLGYVLVKEWSSMMECGRNGFDQGSVSKCCNNKYGKQGNVYKGYRWIKKEDYDKLVDRLEENPELKDMLSLDIIEE